MRVLSLLCCVVPLAAQTLPHLELRLLTPLSSFAAKRGEPFSAIVIRPVIQDDRVYIPAGSLVYGSVASAKAVGSALIRERASLSLRFEELELPSGVRAPLNARLASIDNARETVNRAGVIRGVLAANNPQGFTQGLWRRPNPRLMRRSLYGLTGLTGKMASRYSFAPGWSAGLLAARGALTSMPEPEIRLPSGVDLRLRLSQLPEFSLAEAGSCCRVPEAVSAQLADLPASLDKRKGKPVIDILNVAFLGSRSELDAAFLAAGWTPAEPLTRSSFARAYKAYTTMSGYAAAPVSLLQWRGASPEVVYQKSFNTLSQRHHVRIFAAGEIEGRGLWLGAGTHDVGIAFEPASLTFTHRVDLRIDRERAKIATDLTFAGCAEKLGYVERPQLAGQSPPSAITDGRLLVLSLQSCSASPDNQLSSLPSVPGNRLTRLSRRLLLETRHYLLRSNAYYFAFAGIRDHLWPFRHRKAAQHED